MGSITHAEDSVQTPKEPQTVYSRVVRVLTEVLNLPESAISSDAELELALGADSMDLAELEIALDDEFQGEWAAGVHLQDNGLRLSMTVLDVTKHIQGMLQPLAACARHY